MQLKRQADLAAAKEVERQQQLAKNIGKFLSDFDAFLASYRKGFSDIKGLSYSALGFVDKQLAELTKQKVEFFKKAVIAPEYKVSVHRKNGKAGPFPSFFLPPRRYDSG